jgi:hypothetical protein
MNIIYKKCVDLFEIETGKNPIIPLINFRFKKKKDSKTIEVLAFMFLSITTKLFTLDRIAMGKVG